jgi:hypothetical protein
VEQYGSVLQEVSTFLELLLDKDAEDKAQDGFYCNAL